MIKRFLISLAICITAFTATSQFVSPSNAYADGFSGNCRYILGLTSWDCGVNISNQSTLASGIWTIATNVLADITVIAAYLILGYVIYGGYQYIFSGGDPGKVAAGKKTILHGFIGLAIVLLAHVILSSIRTALGTSLGNCVSSECVDATSMVSSTIQWVIGVAGAAAAIFVVYGGIAYITSAGDPNKLQKAKQIILYALIGLVIVALAEVITAFVTNVIKSANSTSFESSQHQLIAKEIHEN